MQVRLGASLTVTALLVLALAGAAAGADAASRPHGKKQRPRIGIAKRVAVDSGQAPKRSFRDR
ncbi:MAG TPA: hypothetical protein VFX85_11455, partial [Solirubrobacterales bacterium]|nr:hypothetical protein [Solirubrobacterales bacterium]